MDPILLSVPHMGGAEVFLDSDYKAWNLDTDLLGHVPEGAPQPGSCRRHSSWFISSTGAPTGRDPGGCAIARRLPFWTSDMLMSAAQYRISELFH